MQENRPHGSEGGVGESRFRPLSWTGLNKVRYYGLWHPSRRQQAARARQMLQLDQPAIADTKTPATEAADQTADPGVDGASGTAATAPARICPCCQQGHLRLVGRLYPKQASGP